jgi:hypothetical protein
LAWLGAREESRVDENLLSAGRRSAVERIAALILILFRRAAALSLTEDHTFSFPLSQQHIADARFRSSIPTRRWHGCGEWECSPRRTDR